MESSEIARLIAQLERYNEMAGRDADELATLRAELAASRRWSRRWKLDASVHSAVEYERGETITALRAELAAEREKSATAERQRAEMAAALEKAQEHASWCETHRGCICDCGQPIIVDDPSAILAAHNAEQRRAGAVAGLKAMAENFSEYAIGGDPAVPKAIRMCKDFASAIERGEVEA